MQKQVTEIVKFIKEGTISEKEGIKALLCLFGVRNSFCKHVGCTENYTCGDFCYKHCNCNKVKK